jgi:hypothetical protein
MQRYAPTTDACSQRSSAEIELAIGLQLFVDAPERMAQAAVG